MRLLLLSLAALSLLAASARCQGDGLVARNETGCGELNAACCQLQINGECRGAGAGLQELHRRWRRSPNLAAPKRRCRARCCLLRPCPAAYAIQSVCNTKELYCNWTDPVERCVPVPAVRKGCVRGVLCCASLAALRATTCHHPLCAGLRRARRRLLSRHAALLPRARHRVPSRQPFRRGRKPAGHPQKVPAHAGRHVRPARRPVPRQLGQLALRPCPRLPERQGGLPRRVSRVGRGPGTRAGECAGGASPASWLCRRDAVRHAADCRCCASAP